MDNYIFIYFYPLQKKGNTKVTKKESKLPVKKPCVTKTAKSTIVLNSKCYPKQEEPQIEELAKALQPIDLARDNPESSPVIM